MDGEMAGLIGGILGGLIGVAGGMFGTYCSIRNTHGPRERAFIVRSAVAVWLLAAALVAALFMLPWSYWPWVWGAYLVLLLGLIGCMSRGQQWARARDQLSH